MSIFSCRGNFNLLLLLSQMLDYKVNVKLRDRFGFKVGNNNKVIDGDKVYLYSCESIKVAVLNYLQSSLRI